MLKIVRVAVGGTWLRVKSCEGEKSFWLKPVNPDATIALRGDTVIQQERYSHSFGESQVRGSILH